MQPNEVKEIVQNHLKELLVKHFDPERADNIFQRAGQVVIINNLIFFTFDKNRFIYVKTCFKVLNTLTSANYVNIKLIFFF